MKMDGWIRIGTIVDLDGLKSGVAKVKGTLSKVVGGLGKTLGVGIGAVILGAVATGMYVLSKAIDKANGETGQLQANLSYIGFVGSKIFENLLTPAIDKTTGAVNGLVGALYKVVVYLGYILSEWTGRDLFEGTSVDDYANAMEKANKSASGTAKSTAKIKKDLMSFDEINKLSDDTGSGSGGGGITLPDLPNLGEVPIPEWVKWIGDHKEDILKIVGALAGLFLVIKGLDLANKLSPLLQLFGFGGGSVGSGGGGFSLLGKLALIIASLKVIVDAQKKWKETTKQIKQDVQEVNEKGLARNKEWVEQTDELVDLTRELNNKRKQGNDLIKTAKDTMKLEEASQGNMLSQATMTKTIREADLETLKTNIEIQDQILQKQIDLWKQGKLNKEQEEELKQNLKDQREYLVDIENIFKLNNEDNSRAIELGHNYKEVLKELGGELSGHNWLIKDGTEAWREQTRLAGIYQDKQTSISNVVSGIKGLTNDILDKTKAINNVRLEDKTFKVKIDKSGLVEAIRKLPDKISLGLGMSFNLAPIKRIVGLAQGGIINNPGGGVPLGTNIIGGERGSEAVIPLNDETMDRLGSAIARHMNVNLTNITQMNGRTIGRELKQIANENDFGYNG